MRVRTSSGDAVRSERERIPSPISGPGQNYVREIVCLVIFGFFSHVEVIDHRKYGKGLLRCRRRMLNMTLHDRELRLLSGQWEQLDISAQVSA